MVMLIGISTSLALVFITLFWRHRPTPVHRGIRLLKRFESGVTRTGIRRELSETPGEFLARAADAGRWDPSQRQSLVEGVNRVLYNPVVEETDQNYVNLRNQLRRLKLRLIFG